MIDYHLHTSRCCHASGTPEEYLREAERKGLHEIGFADHFPLGLLDYQPRVQVTMVPGELEEYIKQVSTLKTLSNRVTVRLGIEIDYIPGTEEKLAGLLKGSVFDYVIGSIHFIDGWDFTHPVYAEKYREKDLDALYGSYFDLVDRACRSGLFDIIGHIDVVKKFGYRPEGDLEYRWRNVARTLRETGTCLELNTAGRDAPVGEFYPGRRLLEIGLEEGIPVTLGSDAHKPEQVGRYFPEAVNLLQVIGYREITLFEKRRKSGFPLP